MTLHEAGERFTIAQAPHGRGPADRPPRIRFIFPSRRRLEIGRPVQFEERCTVGIREPENHALRVQPREQVARFQTTQ